MNSLKVLAIHRYFWPDTAPYATLLKEITALWVSNGHDVDVLTSLPSYKNQNSASKVKTKETLDGVIIRRLKLPSESGKVFIRLYNAAKLCLAITWQALFNKKYDVIMISTVPPVVGAAWTALIAKISGARFIYHCMDLQPEVGQISGEFRNKKVYNFLSKLDHFSCKQANPVVVLSEDMRQTLSTRPDSSLYNIKVLNNFNLPVDIESNSILPIDINRKDLTIIFAGNIGRFQGLDIVIDTMTILKERKDIKFIFMGEGADRVRLIKLSQEKGLNIDFIAQQPLAIASKVMQEVDFGFVSLAPSIYKFAYPSKTMTYLAQGCSLIVVAEQNCQLVRDIIENGAGVSVEQDDSNSLANELVAFAGNKDRVLKMKEKAKLLYQKQFQLNSILPKWIEILLGK